MIYRAGMAAILRRAGEPDRPCTVVIQDYTSMERMGKMYDPIDKKALIAADTVTLGTPPDRDLDVLITYRQPMSNPPTEYQKFRITMPVVPLSPGGIVVYWKLTVRGSEPPSLA
jgi:hypothetical protein